MKKIILHVLLAGWFLTGTTNKAQVSAYSFSQSTGSYSTVISGTLIGTTVQDDDVNPATLPFGFTFNGTTYTSVNVCSNGYLSFAPLNGLEYSAISDLQTTELIAAFAQDLFMGTVITGDLTQGSNTITNVSFSSNLNIGDSIVDFLGDFGNLNPIITGISANALVVNIPAQNSVQGTDLFINNGSIRQNVTGTSPNRMVEFEYKNMTRYAVYNEVINFKVRLYETSNKIEVVYGNLFADQIATPSEVGLKGSGNSDFNSRLVDANNTWATSIASSLITDYCDFSSGSMPNNGQTYAWSASACSNPVLSAQQSHTVICAGQSATLNVSGATTYSWSNGSTASTLVVSPSNTSTFIVFGYNGTCSSSMSVVQQVIPYPTLTVAQTKSVICRGTSTTFTASGANTYTWNNGNTASVIVVSPTISTTYTVSGANGECVSQQTITQLVSACTGIMEQEALSKNLSVYPNPFAEAFKVVNVFEQEAKVNLYDMLGNCVYTGKIEAEASATIPCAELKSGMYLLVLDNGNQKVSRKVIKNQ